MSGCIGTEGTGGRTHVVGSTFTVRLFLAVSIEQ